MTEDLSQASPAACCRRLAEAGIRRFFLCWDDATGAVRASHPAVEPLARLLAADRRDYDRHEGIFVQLDPGAGVLHGVFLHRTCRGQGAGGVRFWRYDTVEDYLRDGLRLARGMTLKNALAGLWWGGGKGVISLPPGGAPPTGGAERRRIYEDYGELLTSLRGCYVTAEDVGTTVEDMEAIFRRTRFTTCIPPRLGGSGNPSRPTARGVVRGMEAALAHRGAGTLAGKTVAVQGLGHVGAALVELLHGRGVARVVGTDIDPERCAAIARRFAAGNGGGDFRLEVRAAPAGDLSLLDEPADIFAPCATGGVLRPASIARLAAGIVCGAANNQLEDPGRDDLLLAARGILYMPDFLVNRMGIVNCADEQFGYVGHVGDIGDQDPRLVEHLGSAAAGTDGAAGDTSANSIYNLSLAVLAEAERNQEPPARVALRLAEQRSREPHPLWGHRGAAIVAALAGGAAGAWSAGRD